MIIDRDLPLIKAGGKIALNRLVPNDELLNFCAQNAAIDRTQDEANRDITAPAVETSMKQALATNTSDGAR